MADALRLLDVILGSVLALALLIYGVIIYRDKPVRHSVLALLTSFWLVNFSGVLSNIARLGEYPDTRLPLRLLGHMIGIVFVATAWSMVREGKKPL